MTLEGYLEISSPRNAGCIYRVPRVQGPVIEQGRHKEGLRLQPLEAIPDADHVVIHKLLIEADEEAYLQTANTFTLITSSSWDDWASTIHRFGQQTLITSIGHGRKSLRASP